MNSSNKLLANLDKIHTTVLGEQRIAKNLNLSKEQVVKWCQELGKNPTTSISRKGKNYYLTQGNYIVTINASSYTIITAHRLPSD